MPWSLAITRRTQGLRGREPTERWSPEPGHLMGGELGDEGDHARQEDSRQTETERQQRQREGETARNADGLAGMRSRPNACRSMSARRAKEVSTGTN